MFPLGLRHVRLRPTGIHLYKVTVCERISVKGSVWDREGEGRDWRGMLCFLCLVLCSKEGLLVL